MTEPKMVTEREAVLRERAAWVAARAVDFGLCSDDCCDAKRERLERDAAKLYPLPQRIARDPHEGGIWWRVDVKPTGDKHLMVKNIGDFEYFTPRMMDRFGVTEQRATTWADLYANPTETVEDVAGAAHD